MVKHPDIFLDIGQLIQSSIFRFDVPTMYGVCPGCAWRLLRLVSRVVSSLAGQHNPRQGASSPKIVCLHVAQGGLNRIQGPHHHTFWR